MLGDLGDLAYPAASNGVSGSLLPSKGGEVDVFKMATAERLRQDGITFRLIQYVLDHVDYIAKHNCEVVTLKGGVVTDNQVSSEVLEGIRSFHLMVRQKPGETNSLGLVKIIFPSPDNVYLHGTDAPGLFSQGVRNFSHPRTRNPHTGVAQHSLHMQAEAIDIRPTWNSDVGAA